jgi:hypothetical protein
VVAAAAAAAGVLMKAEPEPQYSSAGVAGDEQRR